MKTPIFVLFGIFLFHYTIVGQSFTITTTSTSTGGTTSLLGINASMVVTASGYTRHGQLSQATGSTFNSANWPSGNFPQDGEYIETTFTIQPGFVVEITSILGDIDRSTTGPQLFSIEVVDDQEMSLHQIANVDFGTGSTAITFSQSNMGLVLYEGTYHVRFYGYAATDTRGTADPEKDLIVNGLYSVFVDLSVLDFTAEAINNAVEITCQVSDTHFADLTIQHSEDGINFTDLVSYSLDRTNENFVIQYLHQFPTKNNYYRLRSTYSDGTSEFSHIIQAILPEGIYLFQNGNKITIRDNGQEKLHAYLVSMNGKVNHIPMNKEITYLTLPSTSGFYIVIISDRYGKTLYRKKVISL